MPLPWPAALIKQAVPTGCQAASGLLHHLRLAVSLAAFTSGFLRLSQPALPLMTGCIDDALHREWRPNGRWACIALARSIATGWLHQPCPALDVDAPWLWGTAPGMTEQTDDMRA
mmetsp:Transcript_15855/g.43063  ORF Transcript_15855/g.43063 Transcript_15855/m.43063 type:complete len:115 (-) Transcript_15855:4044-4388(-)